MFEIVMLHDLVECSFSTAKQAYVTNKNNIG